MRKEVLHVELTIVAKNCKLPAVLLRNNCNFGSVFKGLGIVHHEFILLVTTVNKQRCRDSLAHL